MMNIADNNAGTNFAHIRGKVMTDPTLSHRTYGEAFYTFETGVLRNSGYEDQMTVMASERILHTLHLEPGTIIDVQGQVRTYNEDVEGHNRLNIVVFARELREAEEEVNPMNEIYLEGYLCKDPVSRTSPLGRRICDLMLAVNRMYNKSDYIPCIAWGRNAVYSGTMQVGDKVAVHGRLQSRQYRKKSGDGDVTVKTAYEVSILQLETFEESVLY
jgi:primosomal replication protein N